jgi:hypothetical protein
MKMLESISDPRRGPVLRPGAPLANAGLDVVSELRIGRVALEKADEVGVAAHATAAVIDGEQLAVSRHHLRHFRRRQLGQLLDDLLHSRRHPRNSRA